jgi:tRNA-dihydrouridine synthase A
MLAVTDKHFRALCRLLSQRCELYTEMVVDSSLVYGDHDRFLQISDNESPVVLQLGGSEPETMARCAQWVKDAGFDQVNLNIGCPSDRVQSGRFGACLMADPVRVGECVSAMAGIGLPVTVKTRIGIDEHDDAPFLRTFVDTVAEQGCQHFIVHARKAWLNGLSPRQNRRLPALNYPRVYDLKRDRDDLTITINGGITTIDQAEAHYQHVDGVMIGREVWNNPYLLAEVDQRVYQAPRACITREAVLMQYINYVDRQLERDVFLKHLVRPLIGLYHGCPGAATWRRHLTEASLAKDADSRVIMEALDKMNAVGENRQQTSGA